MQSKNTAWADQVKPGDIVLYAFPVDDPESGIQAKLRPCLVLEADFTPVGKRLLIAFGTSKLPVRPRGYDIVIRSREGFEASGLKKATRFSANRLVSVSVTSTKFDTCGGTKSPIIGHLCARGIDQMNRVRGRLHAEHDMAAERRRKRSERRRAVVEIRHPSPKTWKAGTAKA